MPVPCGIRNHYNMLAAIEGYETAMRLWVNPVCATLTCVVNDLSAMRKALIRWPPCASGSFLFGAMESYWELSQRYGWQHYPNLLNWMRHRITLAYVI